MVSRMRIRVVGLCMMLLGGSVAFQRVALRRGSVRGVAFVGGRMARRSALGRVGGFASSSGSSFEAAAAAVVGPPTGERKSLSSATRKEVAFRQKYECAACGCLLPPDHEVDHIVPVALNGSDALCNLQALCRPCHAQKTRDQRHEILDARKAAAAAEAADEEETPPSSRPRPAPPGTPVLTLNAQQGEAVECGLAPVRVVAGPGTGKTRVLTRRVAHLVRSGQATASSVLALTFTNRAANELRERIEEEVGPGAASSISVGTFHRVCLTILRDDVDALEGAGITQGFAIYDQAAMIKLVGQCVSAKPPVGLGLDKADVKPNVVQSLISSAKNAGLDAARYGELARNGYDGASRTVAEVFELYEKTLVARNAVDFDDMLSLTLRLLRDSPATRAKYQRRWRNVLVDEFQDTNGVQYGVLKLLSSPDSSVFVVGDADQAIYGWRPRGTQRP